LGKPSYYRAIADFFEACILWRKSMKGQTAKNIAMFIMNSGDGFVKPFLREGVKWRFFR
jgi:hypothetical protein